MFFKKLLRKLFVLLLIVGLGYGCYTLFTQKNDKMNAINAAFGLAYDELIEALAEPEPDEARIRFAGDQLDVLYEQSKYYRKATENGESAMSEFVDLLVQISRGEMKIVINAQSLADLKSFSGWGFPQKDVKAKLELLKTITSEKLAPAA